MARDARIDAYIAKAAPFAQPILTELRARLHAACPDLDEAIKWSMPAFTYRGHQVANIAAFKAHATLNFWRREVVGAVVGDTPAEHDAMGQFGKLTSVADLPSAAEIAAMLARVVAMVEAGAKVPRAPKHAKPAAEMPADLQAALAAVPAAAAAFEAFPPGARREYIDWVVEAKQLATRARRIAQAVDWCAEGKRRYWQMAGR